MAHEVVVVGGGIGGLTVAALLAQRGTDVCLLEREPQVGGCAASFDKFDYSFEQGDGLYSSWQPNEIHDRVFGELPVDPPEVRRLEPAYVVRLPDQTEIALNFNKDQFEESLRNAFPECANDAIAFYRELRSISGALRESLPRSPGFLTASNIQESLSALSDGKTAAQIISSTNQTTIEHLDGLSFRFRRFIDVQLQALAQGDSTQVSYLYAALALTLPQEGLFAIRGGASALAERLEESIKRSGGKVRLNATALRLSYDSTGAAVGVDLLSGETVIAAKAIVSNLTLWDTYGRLIGLNRSPDAMRKRLKALRGWGAYLIYVSMDAEVALPSNHLMTIGDWQDDQTFDPENNQLLFAAAPSWDSRAPKGKRAVTVHAFTDVDEWFTFHHDQSELEENDQRMLEECWARLHRAMPELGDTVEVIETATPRSFYDQTRRKLGMVGGVALTPDHLRSNATPHETSLPNLYIVSDTVAGGGIADLTSSALALVNKLAPHTR